MFALEVYMALFLFAVRSGRLFLRRLDTFGGGYVGDVFKRRSTYGKKSGGSKCAKSSVVLAEGAIRGQHLC